MAAPDLGPFVEAWRRRFARREIDRAELERKARGLLPALSAHLVERYGARRVWLFGSLAEGGFRPGSDIDLAVEGLPGGAELFRAGAELDEIASPLRVDLVPLEEAWDGLDHPAATWHRELLHAMTYALPGFRPGVIRPDLEPRLLERMKFRHVDRNLYSFDLRWERVRPLADEARAAWPMLHDDLLAFARALEAMALDAG